MATAPWTVRTWHRHLMFATRGVLANAAKMKCCRSDLRFSGLSASFQPQLPLQFRVLLAQAFREQALQSLVFVLERDQVLQIVTI